MKKVLKLLFIIGFISSIIGYFLGIISTALYILDYPYKHSIGIGILVFLTGVIFSAFIATIEEIFFKNDSKS